MVYSTRQFVVCLSMCHFVLVFLIPFSIAITSLGEERANLSAFRTFVRFVLVWICRFPLPLWVWEGLRFVIVALPGLFPYLFFLYEPISKIYIYSSIGNGALAHPHLYYSYSGFLGRVLAPPSMRRPYNSVILVRATEASATIFGGTHAALFPGDNEGDSASYSARLGDGPKCESPWGRLTPRRP